MSSSPLAALDSAGFQGLLHSRFQVQAGGAADVELELVEVTPGRRFGSQSAGAAEYESFSVLFEGSDAVPLAQGIHSFAHATLGSLELFIVPVGRRGRRLQYEAVFNRTVKAS